MARVPVIHRQVPSKREEGGETASSAADFGDLLEEVHQAVIAGQHEGGRRGTERTGPPTGASSLEWCARAGIRSPPTAPACLPSPTTGPKRPPFVAFPGNGAPTQGCNLPTPFRFLYSRQPRQHIACAPCRAPIQGSQSTSPAPSIPSPPVPGRSLRRAPPSSHRAAAHRR